MGKISKTVMTCLCCILTLFLMGLCGCATTKRSNLIGLGMTKLEVIKIMGTPASSKGQSNKEILEYVLYPTWDSTWGNREYFWVTLENGKVVQYGRAGDFGSAMPTDRREYDIKIQNK